MNRARAPSFPRKRESTPPLQMLERGPGGEACPIPPLPAENLPLSGGIIGGEFRTRIRQHGIDTDSDLATANAYWHGVS